MDPKGFQGTIRAFQVELVEPVSSRTEKRSEHFIHVHKQHMAILLRPRTGYWITPNCGRLVDRAESLSLGSIDHNIQL